MAVLRKDINELLTQTGPGTPMGEVMRRYWMPILLEREVADLGPGQGLSVYPPPFAREGRAIGEGSRKPVPIAELHGFYAEIAAQVRELPDGASFRMRTTE